MTCVRRAISSWKACSLTVVWKSICIFPLFLICAMLTMSEHKGIMSYSCICHFVFPASSLDKSSTSFTSCISSGGFTYFGQYLQKKYGIDYVYANELEIIDGKLTGRYLGDVVDGKRKAELLRLIAQVEKVDIAQTIAVGDGANDLPMLGVAGLGIAFHAKPKVVANAKQSINTIGLDGVLYFLGFKDSYLNM